MARSVARTRGARWRRRLVALASAVAAVALVAALAGAAWIRRSLPPRSGAERLPGATAPATVRFDARGIPYVEAATEEDAWRALGWLHAGDRFFQMELRRRAARGRLAELFGAAAVDFDRAARRDGHAAAAEADEAALPPRLLGVVRAYADGVNAYLAARPLPRELVVLGARPEPWTVGDSLAFGRLMLAGLSEAPGRRLQDAVARGLLPATDGADVLPQRTDTEGAGDVPGDPRGSNAWAVVGARTAHGKPILANDPHLAREIPGVWYAAHLATADGLRVAGLTLAGVPGVLVGRSERFAWGITMAQVDDADLFLEEVDPIRRTYARDGIDRRIVSRVETIRVRGGAEVVEEVHATDRGALVGGFAGGVRGWTGVTLAFAPFRSRASLEAFLRAARAGELHEFDRAWAAYGGPAINVCWASADGAVGQRLAGAVPARRGTARDARGISPSDWDGIVPDADLPRIIDPVEGLVASANDDWSSTGRPLAFPGFYAANDRAKRIRELLLPATGLAAADMNRFQNDVRSPFAARFVERLASLRLPASGPSREAIEILLRWDRRAERRGPARLFYATLDRLARRQGIEGWGRFLDAFDDPATEWDDPATPPRESRDDAAGWALAAALEEIRRADGPDPAAWSWGKVHALRYEHPFSSRLPLPFLRRFLDVGPIELPGEIHSLNVQGFRLGREPKVRHIPSARLVLDLGAPDASTLVLPLGQSGQFQDPHYADQTPAWAEGHTFPFPWTAGAIERETVSRLRLEP